MCFFISKYKFSHYSHWFVLQASGAAVESGHRRRKQEPPAMRRDAVFYTPQYSSAAQASTTRVSIAAGSIKQDLSEQCLISFTIQEPNYDILQNYLQHPTDSQTQYFTKIALFILEIIVVNLTHALSSS